MRRSLNDSLSQLVTKVTPRQQRLKVVIHRVHYTARRITCGARGYGLIKRVPVQQGIALGTPDAKIVVAGNTAWIERQPDNTWLCTAIRTKTRCATGTEPSDIETDTTPDTSIGYTVNGFSDTIVPDTLFFPPFEALGMLSLPSEQPPPPIFCLDSPPWSPGKVLCYDDVNHCLYWCDPTVPPPVTVPGSGRRTYIATDVGVVYTDNYLDATPSWFATNNGLSGDALNVFRFLFDPFSTGGILAPSLLAGYIVTLDGVYRNSSLPTGTWTQLIDDTALLALIGPDTSTPITNHFTRELVCPINIPGYVAFVAVNHIDDSGYTAYRHWWVYSVDYGATWQVSTFWFDTQSTIDSNGLDLSSFAFPSNTVSGTLYLSTQGNIWYNGSGRPGFNGAATPRLFTSTDSGLTWTDTRWISNTNSRAFYLVIPYADASGTVYGNDSRCYRDFDDVGNSTDALQLTTTFPLPDNPTEWTADGFNPGTNCYSGFLDMCTFNEDFQYLLLRNTVSGTGFAYTNDGGTTWTRVGPQAFGENDTWQCLSALPSNNLFCEIANVAAVSDARTYLTLDGGATFDSREGDLNAVLVGIGSTRSIVPDSVLI